MADLPKPVVRPWLGVGLLLLCAALWSLNGPLIKLLQQEQVPGVSIACCRSLLGGLVFLPWSWPRRGTLARVRPGWSIGGVLLFTLMTATFVISTTQTSAANAIILQYTSPIWVFVLGSLLLHEHPRLREGLVLLVAMVGVGIIFWGNPRGDAIGLALALVSGFGYGALTVVLRAMRPVHPLVVIGLNSLGSGLLLLGPALVWGRFAVTGMAVGLLVFMAVVQFTMPYVLFAWALRHLEARRAALLLLLEALLNPLLTYLAVGERPNRATLIGGPLILLGVAGSLLVGRRVAEPAGD